MRLAAAALAAAIAVLPTSGASADGITISHAIAEFGEPKYGPDFAHFDYANPDAPEGRPGDHRRRRQLRHAEQPAPWAANGRAASACCTTR